MPSNTIQPEAVKGMVVLDHVPEGWRICGTGGMTMKDLIDRQAAIRWVKTECNPYGKPTLDFESGKKVIEYLEQLPSAQPERKKGRWIDAVLPNDSGGLQVQVCDQCNTFFPLAYTGGGHNFCPNCGADMRGEEE